MPDATLKNAPTACDPVTLEIVRGAADRAFDEALGSADGAILFQSALASA